MDKTEIRALLNELWPSLPGRKGMAAKICELSAPPDVTKDELLAGAKKIDFEHKASTPSDDDEYWLAQSPFDQKLYTFASLFCAGWPIDPVYIDNNRPERFDAD